ncbi:uncharacterized protein BDV14DRAFT_201475 [Aspergillus stella-maris]|uniref:uncharacterized protein n=1 Tax=Aspergillus stella-maris TaxID=1810926 RepID=UPI003CCE0E34
MRSHILPLALLSAATSVLALDSFQDYIEEYLPSCVVNCTTTAAESSTNCGEGSIASTNQDDISCLCSAFTSTDVSAAQDFATSLTECFLSAGCSDEELGELENLDTVETLGASDELCGEGTGDSLTEGDGDVEDDDGDDSDSDDGDNGASMLISSANALLAAGALIAVTVF